MDALTTGMAEPTVVAEEPSPPSATPEPESGPQPTEAADDQELINKVVPIVTAAVIVIIIVLIYFCCYKKKKCGHQEVERGDSPGDIGYYHNKGYNTDDKPPAETGKNGKAISWVNERNGVETIPYNLAPEPEKQADTNKTAPPASDTDTAPPADTAQLAEAGHQHQQAESGASTSSKVPAGYVPVNEEERRQNQPLME